LDTPYKARETGSGGSENILNPHSPANELTGPARFSREDLAPSLKARVRRPGVWIAAGCILLLVLYFVFAKRSRNASPDAAIQAAHQAVPVTAAAAKRGDLNLYISAIGTVIPFNTVTIKSRVDGAIDKILFTEGQTVHAGDQLFEIDPRPYEVQLTQARGQMARDQANLANARTLYERDKVLFAQNVIARQDLDNQRAQVGQFEGTVKNDQGLIDAALLNLAYTKITAPITGRVGLRLVDLGNIVHATDPNGLLVLTQLQPIAAVFSVPEDELPRITVAIQNAPTPLQVDLYDRDFKFKLAAGFLLTTDNQIDQSTGTIKLKAQLANIDNLLFPNQFVNVKLLVETLKSSLIVPAAAVQRSSQGSYVYVVQADQTVAMRPVKVGASQNELVALDSGVQAGELVVIDGVDKLRQGSKVTVQMAANPVKPGATQ
jgi:multidrug efflux system membrane fusion protein